VELTREQLLEWKHSQGTENFVKTIEKEIANIRSDWSNLGFTEDGANDRALGRVCGLLDILKSIEDAGVEE